MTEICNECYGRGCSRCDGFGRLFRVIEQVRCGPWTGTGRVNMMEFVYRYGNLPNADELWIDCMNCDGSGIVRLVLERQLVTDREIMSRMVTAVVVGVLTFLLLLPLTRIGLLDAINQFGAP